MSEVTRPSQDMWSNSWLFVLAAAGSAVGLGNIWKFPYITGENGGGAFVLVYLICITIVGVPIMISEILLGKMGRASPINSILKLCREHNRPAIWSTVGFMGVLAGFLILSFYAVIAGWVCYYVILSVSGEFSGADAAFVAGTLDGFLADPILVGFWFTLFMVLTVFFVSRGVNRGLELCVQYAMPAVLVLLLILIGYGIYAGGFGESFSFMFSLDFSQLSYKGVLVALGHAFFTLSLGMGAIMAYGAYVPEGVSVRKAAITIAVLDTVIAILAGLAIFSVVFAYELEPNQSVALLFQTVPLAFGNLPFGTFFGTLFFLLVALAALTSAISLTEPAIAYCKEKFQLSRVETAVVLGVICWILGLGSVMSFNHWKGDVTVFSFLDQFTQLVLLPVGGLVIALLVGWGLPRTVIWEKLGLTENWQRLIWQLLVGFITPIAVLVVCSFGIVDRFAN